MRSQAAAKRRTPLVTWIQFHPHYNRLTIMMVMMIIMVVVVRMTVASSSRAKREPVLRDASCKRDPTHKQDRSPSFKII